MAPGSRRSGVWANFSKITEGTARCHRCQNVYKFHRNTTNLWNHLKHSHLDVYNEAKLLTPADVSLRVREANDPEDVGQGEYRNVCSASSRDSRAGRKIIPLPSGRSEVWKRNLFGFYSDDGKTIADRQKAICTLCNVEIPYSGNTTNLGIHLAKRHPNQYMSMKEELDAAGHSTSVLRNPIKSMGHRPTMGSTVMASQGVPPTTPLPRQSSRALGITDAMATFLAQDLQSTTLVEGAGFHNLLSKIEPRYEPANLQDVQQALNNRREAVSAALLQNLSKVEACALTTDCWTAESGRNYCTLMARYVDADWTVHHHVLKTLEITPDQTHANHIWDVNKVLADWDLMPHMVYNQQMEGPAATVTLGEGAEFQACEVIGMENGAMVISDDNPIFTVEANQMKVIAGLTNDNGNVALALKHLGMPSVPCFAYLINEALCAAIGPSESSGVCELINRARQLVNHFLTNSKDRFVLSKRCEDMGAVLGGSDNTGDGVVNQGELFVDVPHRWVTTADMIGRLLEGKGPLSAVLMSHCDRTVRELGLTAEEWYQLEELYGALKSVSMAIDVLGSGDESASCAMVAPMLARLKEKFMKISEHDTPAVHQFKQVVWDHLTPHYEEGSEMVSLFNVATLLDPRFKDLAHLPEERRSVVLLTARQMLLDMEAAQNLSEAQPAKKARRHLEKLDLLFSSTDDDAGGSDSSSTAIGELDKYLQEQAIEIKESPLDWWRGNWHRYGLLSKLARRHLCVPAVAVPSEYVLKQNATTFYGRRRRLLPTEVDGMIFLNKNIDLVVE